VSRQTQTLGLVYLPAAFVADGDRAAWLSCAEVYPHADIANCVGTRLEFFSVIVRLWNISRRVGPHFLFSHCQSFVTALGARMPIRPGWATSNHFRRAPAILFEATLPVGGKRIRHELYTRM